MEAFILGLIGIAISSFWLAIYVVALFAFGKKLAARFRLRVGVRAMGFIISTVFGCIAALATLIPGHPLLIFGFSLGLWVLHAPSIFSGYWSGYDEGRLSDERRWADNVHEWLNEWEDDGFPNWIGTRGDGDEGKADD